MIYVITWEGRRVGVFTDRPQLDLFEYGSWTSILKGAPDGFGVISAEHVLEHFEPAQVGQLVAAAFTALQPGGTFRVAVPDGYKPNMEYMAYVRPGCTPSNKGQNHMVAWTIDSLPAIFRSVGFEIIPQEYFDMSGTFHSVKGAYDQDHALGMISRSFKHDRRNGENYRGDFGLPI